MNQLHEANWTNVSLCTILILLVVICKRIKAIAKRKQGSSFWKLLQNIAQVKEILVVILGLLFVKVTKKEDGSTSVPVVGPIPQGLPPFQLPWQQEATRKLLEGPSDVLHNFLLSGVTCSQHGHAMPPVGKGPMKPNEYFRRIERFESISIYYTLDSRRIFFSNFLDVYSAGAEAAQVIVAFSTFLTSYSSFKKQALVCDYNLDARQELYALGAAGVLGSFFGAFPPSGSLSRTGLAVQLGVKSQICGICTAATVAAGLIFLAPALEDLPKASLAAIVMVSAEGLMDFQMPKKLWQSAPQSFRSSFRKDLLVWMVGFLCTILAGALYGIVLSVLVAIAQVVAEAATPKAVMVQKHIKLVFVPYL